MINRGILSGLGQRRELKNGEWDNADENKHDPAVGYNYVTRLIYDNGLWKSGLDMDT